MYLGRLVLPLLLVLSISIPSATLMAEERVVEAVEVTTRPIRSFRIRSDEEQFGPFQFIGGFELKSSYPEFGGFSSFRFVQPGGRIVGVTDNGMWFFAGIERDEAFRPVGVSDFSMQPILSGNHREKESSDAEAVAIKGSKAYVGFERQHRITQFELGNDRAGNPERDIPPLIPLYELRTNRGFETLAFAPEDSALAGALVVVTEKSLDPAGNIFAAVLEGPREGIFTVKRDAGYDITDGAFLPNGDMLLLERRFSVLSGVAMRIRRIPASAIAPGHVADGTVLLEADMDYQTDNMEGLDVWRAPDGALMVSLMSDDNQSIFQRNLYLEFRYVGK